jgi:hypothetical protein
MVTGDGNEPHRLICIVKVIGDNPIAEGLTQTVTGNPIIRDFTG